MAKQNEYESRMHILVKYFLLPLQTLLSQTGSPGSTQSVLVTHATQTLLLHIVTAGFTQSAFVTHATQTLFVMSQTGSPGSVQSVFVLHATITKFV